MRARVAIVSLLLGGCLQAAADGEAFDDRCEEPTASVEALSSISCGSHTDTGYRAGSAFTITVVTVDGHPVERETANAYYVMAEAAARAASRSGSSPASARWPSRSTSTTATRAARATAVTSPRAPGTRTTRAVTRST